MNRYGTSVREQEIFYFVQKFFSDAVSGYKIKSKGKVIEVDIFIPSLKLVIEYDGGHWHKNKVDTDNRKNSIINNAGFSILRVREFGLPDLEHFAGDVIEVLNDGTFNHIVLTLNYLSELASGSIKAQIESFKIDETVYQKSIKTIYANRYPDIIEPNLSDMCGIEYWSKEKNTPLVPTHIAKFDWVPAVLICESGREILLPRYHREFKTDCQKSSVSNECGECCYGVFCPLIKYCKKEGDKKVSCPYVEKIVWKMIDNNQSLKKLDACSTFKRWMIQESDIGEKIIRKFNSCLPKSKKREAIAYFLGLEREIYRQYVKEKCFDIYSLF